MLRLASILVLLLATVASGQSLRLTDMEVRPGTYARVEVVGLSAGEATIDGGAGATAWRHGGGLTVLPVLVPQQVGTRWPITLNGRTFDVEVREVLTSPPVSAVTPAAYELIGEWNPERPARERWSIVLTAICGGGAILLGARLTIRRRWTICALSVGIAGAVIAGLLVWRAWRSPIASRVAAIPTGGGLCDEWVWLAAPGANDTRARVRATAETVPVAFSAAHLGRLSPILHCDSTGAAVEVELTVPAGQAVAVVRTGRKAAPNVPPWAAAIARRFGARE